MTILLVGGGTGGHITPLLAVAHELKQKRKDLRLIAVTDKANNFSHILENDTAIDHVVRISAGKLRRYPNQSLLEKAMDFKTIGLNIRDVFRTVVGCFEAVSVLKHAQPDSIFIKGGFVGVPVGLAARLRRVPFVTHDSDAEPGLANRIIGRWAYLHALGMPEEFYSYPAAKKCYVGIPVSARFKKVTSKQKAALRKDLKVPSGKQLVFVTGGSQGSQNLNRAVFASLPQLTKGSKTYVIHQTGSGEERMGTVTNDNYEAHEYIADMPTYTGAADVVVTRAGSSIAELAAQEKAIIAVPAPHLAGGHQLKNAQYLKDHDAAIVLSDTELLKNPDVLGNTVAHLLEDSAKRKQLSANLHACYAPDAARQIADILLEVAG